MGFTEKHQVADHHGNLTELDGNNKKWVVSEIPLRAPLKPIYTKTPTSDDGVHYAQDQSYDHYFPTTPTSEESRITSRMMTCPPAPRKRKATFKCSSYGGNGGGVREFFTPPDLESVFIRHVERAK